MKKKATEIKRFLLDMIADARKECRELTPEEQQLFNEQKNELIAISESIKATEDKLDKAEEELEEVAAAAEKAEEEEKPEEAPAEAVPEEKQAEDGDPEEKPEDAPEEKPEEEQKAADDEEINKDEEAPEEKPDEKPSENVNKNDGEEKPKDEVKNPDEDDKKESKNNFTNMKNFSLLKAIRAAADGRQFDEMTAAVIAEGQKDFRAAGLDTTSTLLLPGEKRTISVTNEHDEVVKEDWEPLLLPLFKNKILDKAHHMTGLRNDVRLPAIDAVDVYWEGENTQNKETTTSFSHLVMKPHRVSASIYLSKQFLLQESVGAEQTIRNLLIEALAQKLESTFLGKGAADNTGGKNIPAGLLNGKVAKVVDNFAKMCEFEGDAVDACYDLNGMQYALSPKAWAAIRGTWQYGGKTSRMVMEGKEIDGRPYDISQNLADNEFILINWNDIYIGQWGGTEISVDSTSHDMARTNQVCVTINAYFDALARRSEAIQLATVKAGTIDPSTND